ncbi:DNA mismatch repair protein MutS [Lacibacter luteus]|uniref:DNA mismatch repair protein MutS n=1 Tax=Lacibacter luteus TaxID=2508719 RepID=A0A4Q1CF65_9BACT|nr:DNA mismatch repair protein MutS [Lacibacter luteus]RXK58544.1 DNA mismatch repair protein MutS [Lacibacter luteus]
MEIDKVTYYDLSIFNPEEEYSLLQRINFCNTVGGREQLEYLLTHPHKQLSKILQTQQALQHIGQLQHQWPTVITNGTILMIEKFYGYPFDHIPNSYSPFPSLLYRLFDAADFRLIRYTVGHFIDFLKGMDQLQQLLWKDDGSPVLQKILTDIRKWMSHEHIREMIATGNSKLLPQKMLQYGHFLQYHYKAEAEQLIDLYHKLDAFYSMAVAVKKFNLHFPTIYESNEPVIKAKGLYHLLLKTPVAYDITLNPQANFLFLTGANMAGKSTFIKSMGCAVYLAHLGMGVPAASFELSLFDGLLSNIQVQDNIVKGESYFFNEVQRIKNTVLKITDGRKWLVLIDELFKGTNIQDAMHCSTAVIKGLVKIKSSLFILSTHLYEIGEELKQYPNISFRYFETTATNEQLQFSYQLKEGISNDRFGYLILKREKVVEMLEKL